MAGQAHQQRRQSLMGLAGHGLMSVLCALVPSITMLAITRTLQGVAGAAVAVVAMAIVRDLFSGYKAAQLLSRLVLVLGIAPILAPSLGGALLQITSWRGIFVVLAAIALGLFLLAMFALPETLPPSRRIPASLRGSLKAYRGLFADRAFLVLVAVAALMFSVLFAYIAGSSFILQGMYGLTPQQFGLAFSSTAVGLIIATQLNPLLLKRWTPIQILSAAVVIALSVGLVLLDDLDHRIRWPGRIHGSAVDHGRRARAVVPERPSRGPQPARRDGRNGSGHARRQPVRDGRSGRSAGRRTRQRHPGADGGDHGHRTDRRRHAAARSPARRCAPPAGEGLRPGRVRRGRTPRSR